MGVTQDSYVCNNKEFALFQLNKCDESLNTYDKAIEINSHD
jgi:hypothetical protein